MKMPNLGTYVPMLSIFRKANIILFLFTVSDHFMLSFRNCIMQFSLIDMLHIAIALYCESTVNSFCSYFDAVNNLW